MSDFFKINQSLSYICTKEIFRVFFQDKDLIINNEIISKKLAHFFDKTFRLSFQKHEFEKILAEIDGIEKSEINDIFKLLSKNDIFHRVTEGYKELLYTSRKWYNPYSVSHKLDYSYKDVPYYFEQGLLSNSNPFEELDKEGLYGYLDNLFVDSDFRKQGIAKKIKIVIENHITSLLNQTFIKGLFTRNLPTNIQPYKMNLEDFGYHDFYKYPDGRDCLKNPEHTVRDFSWLKTWSGKWIFSLGVGMFHQYSLQ